MDEEDDGPIGTNWLAWAWVWLVAALCALSTLWW
jgi:hypothetical protein